MGLRLEMGLTAWSRGVPWVSHCKRESKHVSVILLYGKGGLNREKYCLSLIHL